MSIRSCAKGGETLTCELWHAIIIRIGDDIEQLLHTVAADRRDDPEFGKMGPDRINHRGLLPNEKVRVRWSMRQLCCSDVLVSTKRIFGLVTASQIASASAASFFWRLR